MVPMAVQAGKIQNTGGQPPAATSGITTASTAITTAPITPTTTAALGAATTSARAPWRRRFRVRGPAALAGTRSLPSPRKLAVSTILTAYLMGFTRCTATLMRWVLQRQGAVRSTPARGTGRACAPAPLPPLQPLTLRAPPLAGVHLL